MTDNIIDNKTLNGQTLGATSNYEETLSALPEELRESVQNLIHRKVDTRIQEEMT